MSTDLHTKRKPSWIRRLIFRLAATAFVLLVLLVILAGGAAYIIYDHVQRQGIAGELVRVEIAPGATGDGIAQNLADKGLVEHAMFFKFALRMDQDGGIIKAGTYDLGKGLSAQQLLASLHAGPNVRMAQKEISDDQKLTIAEGLSIAQMARQFSNPQRFIEEASKPDLLAAVDTSSDSLEGFLMPNTYFFDTVPDEAMAVERMVNQFLDEYQALQGEYPESSDRDIMEVVTVASLVEEEARLDEERPVVAAVIYNRLARKMPLAMDSTLQYALNKYGERMLNSDKEVDSPYNTYKHRGLPPGPISNPGVESLRAALAPADVKYLYFVSNADGKSHTFSNTLQEHNSAVARFRKEIAAQRRRAKED